MTKTDNKVAKKEDMIVLKKINNFSKLGITPTLHMQKSYDPMEDGEPSNETFNRASFPGIKRNLSPEIQDGEWCFEGSYDDLVRIAKALKLRDKENRLIIPEEDGWRYNLECPFFNHHKLWTSEFIENGSRALSYNNPLEEFYARVSKGSHRIRRDGELQSAFEVGEAQYEMYSTASKARAKSEVIDLELDAMVALKELLEDEDKLKVVASIFVPAMEVDSVTQDEIKAELVKDAKNTVESARFGGQTPQKYFLSICKKPIDELVIMAKVNKVTSYGGIRRNQNGYTFKGARIPGVTNEIELVQYYLDPENSMELKNLEDYLNNR